MRHSAAREALRAFPRRATISLKCDGKAQAMGRSTPLRDPPVLGLPPSRYALRPHSPAHAERLETRRGSVALRSSHRIRRRAFISMVAQFVVKLCRRGGVAGGIAVKTE